MGPPGGEAATGWGGQAPRPRPTAATAPGWVREPPPLRYGRNHGTGPAPPCAADAAAGPAAGMAGVWKPGRSRPSEVAGAPADAWAIAGAPIGAPTTDG